MALGVLITITLGCIAWSLWIRRLAWTCRHEVALTLNVALQGAALALMSPLASETLGHWLHSLTGAWNVEDALGHDCYLVAASAFVYAALSRLGDDDMLRDRFKLVVEYPLVACLSFLALAFCLGNGAKVYHPDFFRVPSDFWLAAYWVVLNAMLIHLVLYGVRALRVLRSDPRSRRLADLYLLAGAGGMLACVIHIATALVPGLAPSAAASFAVWLPACVCAASLAIVSATVWRHRTRPLELPFG